MSKRPSRPLTPILPECEPEEDRTRSRMFDQIQREAEQELQNAERVLLAADSVVGETRHPMRVAEPGQRAPGRREHHQADQSERSSSPWSRRPSAAVPVTPHRLSISAGYPTSGRIRPTVRPTNTPDFGSTIDSGMGADSRKASNLPGPKTFPFRTPLTSEIFYASALEQVETEGDRECADFEQAPNHHSYGNIIDPDPISRSRDPDQKDSKVNRGHGKGSSRYGPKPPYPKDEPDRGTSGFSEGDEYLCEEPGLSCNHLQGNDQCYSSKYGSDYESCVTRMPSWNNNDRYNCSRYEASKTFNCLPPNNALADYHFEFGARAKSPPEYLTGGSPYFQETNEPTNATPSATYLNSSYPQYPTTPPPSDSSAHHNHSNNNRRIEDQQRTGELLAPLQQLSQLTGTDKHSSCSRLFTSRLSMSQFDPPPRELPKGIRGLPKKPDLTKDEINDLIENENLDVNSAFILYSDDRKTYKKPCPKQQKAQMNVKQMVTAHKTRTPINQCEKEKEYSPLTEPDPDDLSPDVAAKMMFSQEVGISLGSCPSQTIKHLFPDEHARPRVTHKSMMSVVNPSDEVEMLSKSSVVPQDGTSDSAYSRMRSKGEDTGSYRSPEIDSTSSGEKREYVVVAQKPARFNITQFRGNLPSWFPGYFTAFPDQVKSLSTVGSPTTAFNRAWASTNPANMPAQDVVILES